MVHDLVFEFTMISMWFNIAVSVGYHCMHGELYVWDCGEGLGRLLVGMHSISRLHVLSLACDFGIAWSHTFYFQFTDKYFAILSRLFGSDKEYY